MASGRAATASEVLNLMDRLQRSEEDRVRLHSGWEIYRAAVEAGMIDADDIDRLARCMQELSEDGLVAYGAASGGMAPLPAVWDGGTVQQLHDWRVTAAGRRDALVYRQAQEHDADAPAGSRSPSRGASSPPADKPAVEGHDVFISHASEDKAALARPLATALRGHGYRVWFDEFELRLGMSLRRSIDIGLVGSRYGVVILSPTFFGKEWPERELDGLTARETGDEKQRILPIWHGVTREDVAAFRRS